MCKHAKETMCKHAKESGIQNGPKKCLQMTLLTGEFLKQGEYSGCEFDDTKKFKQR